MNVALVSQANTRQIGKRTKSLVEVNQKLTPLKLFHASFHLCLSSREEKIQKEIVMTSQEKGLSSYTR